MTEIAVRTVAHPGVGPAVAYAKLRSYTPERASFLFESHGDPGGAGRYSIVGYRVRQTALAPPGVDAIQLQAGRFEDLAAPEELAAALALGSFGYLSTGCANLREGIELCDDEGPAGHFAIGATILLFDHAEDTVTVAGPAKGRLVDRLLWELEHGPEIAPAPTPEPGRRPDGLRSVPDDDKLTARGARAKPYLEELEELLLAQTFVVPDTTLDMFDAYRALCATAPAAFSYFVDFGVIPGAPDTRIAGTSDHMLHVRRQGEAGSLVESLAGALPHPRTTGAPAKDASRAVRKLEEHSRHVWGGAVGYICPGGTAAYALADNVLVAHAGSVLYTVGAALRAEDDAKSLCESIAAAAGAGLAALAAAQAK